MFSRVKATAIRKTKVEKRAWQVPGAGSRWNPCASRLTLELELEIELEVAVDDDAIASC
jgi:hypothetical protein